MSHFLDAQCPRTSWFRWIMRSTAGFKVYFFGNTLKWVLFIDLFFKDLYTYLITNYCTVIITLYTWRSGLRVKIYVFNPPLFFFSQAEGKKLGLVGWVQNTAAGTVQGQLQGPSSKVQEMKGWLKSTGSPKSNITRAEFKNEKAVSSLQHSSFEIVK